eukprot:15472212-Alexandrium_andersonii.AAC.1
MFHRACDMTWHGFFVAGETELRQELAWAVGRATSKAHISGTGADVASMDFGQKPFLKELTENEAEWLE